MKCYKLEIGDIVFISKDLIQPELNKTNDGLKCIELVDKYTDGYIKQILKWFVNEYHCKFGKYKHYFHYYKLKLKRKEHIVGGKYLYIGGEKKMNKELLPCPFCGGEAKLVYKPYPVIWSACQKCNVKVGYCPAEENPSIESLEKCKERTIRKWNTRYISSKSYDELLEEEWDEK